MDHLSDNFGRLTTTAREWTPQQNMQQPQVSRTGSSDLGGAVESELSAAKVKEFVPGKGWSTTTAQGAASSNQSSQQGKLFKLMKGEFCSFIFNNPVFPGLKRRQSI